MLAGCAVLRIDALISGPVYLVGLVQVLNKAGIAVVSARTSPTEEPPWLADAAILDADTLPPPDGLRYITETARTTAVLVLLSDSSLPAEEYLRAGATGVINKRETGETSSPHYEP